MRTLKFYFAVAIFFFYVGIASTQNETRLSVDGSFATAITTVTDTITILDETHQIVLVNRSKAAQIDLPAAAVVIGRIYTIKKIGDGAVTVKPQSGDTFEKAAGSALIFGPNAFITVVSDGTGWWVIGESDS